MKPYLMKYLKTIKPVTLFYGSLYIFLILALYHSSLLWLVTKDWQRDAYSYGYLIPLVVLYLIWEKKDGLASTSSKPTWFGFIPVVFGILLFSIGELSGEFLTIYISLWMLIVGLCWIHLGWDKLKTILFPLMFMLTMFPLPNFLFTKLMLKLQLISSQLGVAIIQGYGLPAYREGNIIDIGVTKMQVVEACSGLNSLISLVVLCLLLVYFFKAHIWKRAALLVSSVPLSIFSNSLRIAITAILYKYFGAAVAEGFFHGFSGLVIFLICIPVLFIEMKILEKLPPLEKKSSPESEKGVSPKIRTRDLNSSRNLQENPGGVTSPKHVFIVAVVLLAAIIGFSQGIEFREKIPMTKTLDRFPLEVGEWTANKRQSLAQIFLDALDLSDYLVADYQNPSGKNVNLYVAYYESQRKGESIHSPATCLPGSGWEFSQDGTVAISNASGKNRVMLANRALMQSGRQRQLSYYWFAARGRVLNNAYQLKIYNFWDALTQQRTDGALVRLITPIYSDEEVADAEKRLQKYVRDIVPVLEEYIPGR